MSDELRVQDGYQHFVSPKRKRMMSPNNCIKISKDQGGSTHVQKHRDVGYQNCERNSTGENMRRPFYANDQLASSTSGSPSTNCFIRKPVGEYSRREELIERKFGSLKKGNLFSEGDGCGCYSTDDDFDGDVDADDKFERRIRENQASEQALSLKKSFTHGRNFENNKMRSTLQDTDHELLETDAGTESDFSGVAGKMSTLSVGKRSSGFSFPAKRGSPGSSPASSQSCSSSVNSSMAMSPALVMDDLLSAETSSSARRPRSQEQQQRLINGKGPFNTTILTEELPSRAMRSRANRLISSAILNSSGSATNTSSSSSFSVAHTPLHTHDASALHYSSSANNTFVKNFHVGSADMTNHSDNTELLFRDHSMTSGASGDSFVHRHRSLEYAGAQSGPRQQKEGGGGDAGGREEEEEVVEEGGDLFHDSNNTSNASGSIDWAGHHHQQQQQGTSLPPRTPFVLKTGQHSSLHSQHTYQHLHAHGASALPRIDETPHRTCAPAAALDVEKKEEREKEEGEIKRDERDGPSSAAVRYDLNGSPIVTPSRSRRRLGESNFSHSAASMSMSQQSQQQQQSHEAAMGDLGTPVTEVGSPAVLEGMDDLVGEEDSDSDAEGGEEEEDRRSVGSMEFDDDEESVSERQHARPRLDSSPFLQRVDQGERDDPELVMITTMRGSDSLSQGKGRDRRHPRRKISSPAATGGGSTAGPKSRLFAEDQLEQEDQEHQYHLFAQRFMVSPAADMDIDMELGLGMEDEELPLFHKSRQSSLDRTDERLSSIGGRQEEEAEDSRDSISNTSMSMSLTRTNSGMTSLNRTNSLNLNRTASDTLMLSRSHNSSSQCLDNSTTGTSSASAFLPLPDQSAFDGPAHGDLSRSSYELSSSYASIDPLFPTPGSARKRRPVQQVQQVYAAGSPSGGKAGGGGPPTPLRSLDWGLLGALSPSAERKASTSSASSHHHQLSLKLLAQEQLNTTSSSSFSALRGSLDCSSTPRATQGIAVPGSEESARSTGSHDSDILVHNRHQHHRHGSSGSIFNASCSEAKGPSGRYPYPCRDMDVASPDDSFSSLSSARPALVRQSSLLDTKVLLSQSQPEDGSSRRGEGGRGLGEGAEKEKAVGLKSGSSGGAPVSFRRDFEEVGLLGSGTFADVYKVRLRQEAAGGCSSSGGDPDSLYFAVKKSKRQFKSKRDREWLMEEVRTMKLVSGQQQQQGTCAFVVPFIRAWQEDSYFYVQMGFAERGTLRELLLHLASAASAPACRSSHSSNGDSSGGPTSSNSSLSSLGALVPDSTVWRVVHDVTAGLRHVHDCGMVHLDIKPANLLITERGIVQIGDFGMAAPIGSSEDGHEGDTRYMAEELLNNPARQPSADIFSMGITLYEIACFCSEEAAAAAAAAAAAGDRTEDFPLRITPRLGLPSNGPLWHTLRENHAPPIPAHRARVLQQLLVATMQREPTARPSTGQILSLADVTAAAAAEADPVLLSAPKHADVRRVGSGAMPPYISRSASVQEILAGGGRAGLSLGLTVAVGDNNEIDYAALGEGAFTPNFAHSSYSPH